MSRSCDLTFNLRPMSGHKVSKSNNKTKRRFFPNLQSCSYPSAIGNLKFSLAVSTMRTIRKYGSFNDYILKIKKKRLTPFGQKLRKRIFIAMGSPAFEKVKTEKKTAEQ